MAEEEVAVEAEIEVVVESVVVTETVAVPLAMVVLFENEKDEADDTVADDGLMPEFVIGSTPLVTKMVDDDEDD